MVYAAIAHTPTPTLDRGMGALSHAANHSLLWMSSIDGFTPGKSFGLSALMSGVNPKNLALTAAVASSISAAGLSQGQEFAALAVFVVLASLTVGLPVLFYVVRGDKADATLTMWKNWLVVNNATVMVVLLLVFGARLLGDGIAILS